MSLREALVGMVWEYGRHMGHADLLRERIDGRIGNVLRTASRPDGVRTAVKRQCSGSGGGGGPGWAGIHDHE